jgi:D-proline reductase (dithiol) PrdB
MVRLTDLTPAQQTHLSTLDCPTFDDTPFVRGGPLAQRRVTLISTAGLMLRGERPVTASDVRYRAIPHTAPAGEVLMSHVSVNYDRSGFQRDLNVVLPRERLQELVDAGEVGAAASEHHSAMGAIHPDALEGPTRRLAATLHERGVDSALLLPV